MTSVTTSGWVTQRRTRRLRNGGEFVTAVLNRQNGSDEVVWWDATEAPPEGTIVTVSGEEKVYDGRRQIHVREFKVTSGVPPSVQGRVISYFQACVEAEVALSTRSPGSILREGQTSSVVLDHDGQAGYIGGSPEADRWRAARHAAIGESLVQGALLVSRGGRSEPLFYEEVELDGGNLWRVSAEMELNSAALAVLGIDDSDILVIHALLDDDPAWAGGASARDHRSIAAGSRERRSVAARTIADFATDPDVLVDLAVIAETGWITEGRLIAGERILIAMGAGSRSQRYVIEELTSLSWRDPAELMKGPLGALLDSQASIAPGAPGVWPIVVPTTLRQDMAIASAMKAPLTVLTGPPGTGKSQVLVNVITAALSAGESVLFAAKNNLAVDVVLERLAAVSPTNSVLRTGNAAERRMLGGRISQLLDSSEAPPDDQAVERGSVNREVDQIYKDVLERASIRKKLDKHTSSLHTLRRQLPSTLDESLSLSDLRRSLAELERAAGAMSQRLPLVFVWRRRSIQCERIDAVRAALSQMNWLLRSAGLPTVSWQVDEIALEVSPRRVPPGRVLHLGATRTHLQNLEAWHNVRELCNALEARLATELRWDVLEDRLEALNQRRTAAGRSLADHLWVHTRTSNAGARRVMRLFADRAADGMDLPYIADGLPAFPVWGVTNLSAKKCLPLTAGLFDLVVIDEASQSDIASALPLLYRAKRALIIGDARQLTHITQLTRGKSDLISRSRSITADAAREFDYTSQSLFSLASTRVSEVMALDLHFRSHPAIITFSNRQFYGGDLAVCSAPGLRVGEAGVSWIDIPGQVEKGPGRSSWRNLEEAEAVVHALATRLRDADGLGLSVGVVSPFRAQVNAIVDLVADRLPEWSNAVTIDTAHRFQGSERDIILLSPVVSSGMAPTMSKFAGDPNVLNVAVTRARRSLVIVGDRNTCQGLPNSPLAALADYVSWLEASVFDSPLELSLYEELRRRGLPVTPGLVVAGHRLDLALQAGPVRIDIECDGAAFHMDVRKDDARDRAIQAAGWTVLRFSGRELSRDLRGCADSVAKAFAAQV